MVAVVSGDKVPKVGCFNISVIFDVCNNDRWCPLDNMRVLSIRLNLQGRISS